MEVDGRPELSPGEVAVTWSEAHQAWEMHSPDGHVQQVGTCHLEDARFPGAARRWVVGKPIVLTPDQLSGGGVIVRVAFLSETGTALEQAPLVQLMTPGMVFAWRDKNLLGVRIRPGWRP